MNVSLEKENGRIVCYCNSSGLYLRNTEDPQDILKVYCTSNKTQRGVTLQKNND